MFLFQLDDEPNLEISKHPSTTGCFEFQDKCSAHVGCLTFQKPLWIDHWQWLILRLLSSHRTGTHTLSNTFTNRLYILGIPDSSLTFKTGDCHGVSGGCVAMFPDWWLSISTRFRPTFTQQGILQRTAVPSSPWLRKDFWISVRRVQAMCQLWKESWTKCVATITTLWGSEDCERTCFYESCLIKCLLFYWNGWYPKSTGLRIIFLTRWCNFMAWINGWRWMISRQDKITPFRKKSLRPNQPTPFFYV